VASCVVSVIIPLIKVSNVTILISVLNIHFIAA